jgi:hypothetical protein
LHIPNQSFPTVLRPHLGVSVQSRIAGLQDVHAHLAGDSTSGISPDLRGFNGCLEASMFLIFHGTWKKKTEMVSPEMICHRVVMVNHEELDSETHNPEIAWQVHNIKV